MEHMMMYSERETLVRIGGGMIVARVGSFASWLGEMNASTISTVVNLAGPRVADVPGISVPGGRRLRR